MFADCETAEVKRFRASIVPEIVILLREVVEEVCDISIIAA